MLENLKRRLFIVEDCVVNYEKDKVSILNYVREFEKKVKQLEEKNCDT